jgi:hypothetical protein
VTAASVQFLITDQPLSEQPTYDGSNVRDLRVFLARGDSFHIFENRAMKLRAILELRSSKTLKLYVLATWTTWTNSVSDTAPDTPACTVPKPTDTHRMKMVVPSLVGANGRRETTSRTC